MIDTKRIETVKSSVDLVALIKSRGVKLRKNGKGYKSPCPFHEDNDPSFSVNPDENLWNCFGCSKGGDAIRFVELFDQVGFVEAITTLESETTPKFSKKTTSKPAPKPELAVKEKKLLARVLDYYQHTFSEDLRGLEYLKDRGLTDHQALHDFGAGFVTGSLRDILPDDKEVIKTLKGLGVLNKKGNETFYNCVVFPLYDQDGGVVNLYGRNINEENQVNHLYLAGSRNGLVNRQAVKRSTTIILTESIIDALTLYDQGFKNVIPAYGVNGLTKDHLSLFNRFKTKDAYIVFDADKAGKDGATKVGEQLKELNITTHTVTLPDKDINIFFNRHTPEEFEHLLKESNPESIEQSEKLNKRKKTLFIHDEHGFTVGYGGRQYQVKGIQRGDTQLKATIKVSKDVADPKQNFELTTIDLYSSRSRVWFAKLCAGLLAEPEELVKEDLGKLMTLVESYKPPEEEQETVEISKADKDLALSFLKSPEMFSELLADYQTMGVTGEETNKLVGYLAATSRKLADPLSVMIQSRSAAGKSTMQDAILSLIPEEDFKKYTRMSDQSLFYQEEESLMHKVLAIEEAEGMGGAAYSIRNIQSAKQITMAVTGKDPSTGKMETQEYKVKGPVSVMITTTATAIDQETASRFIFLTIDESSQMTEAIHEMQREAESLEGLIRVKKQGNLIRKHHTAQRMLKPFGVVNPFAKYLSYPSNSLRSRRDHKKYLGLIRAIAFIHQHQREIKTVEVDGEPVEYIEVVLDDIDKANQLANEVLGQTMDELAKPSRTLLSLAYSMVHEQADKENLALDEVFFTRRLLREYAGWTDWQIKNHIKQLEEMEYLLARVGSKGKEYSYILNYQGQAEETDKCYLNLTTVKEIKKQIERDKTTN